MTLELVTIGRVFLHSPSIDRAEAGQQVEDPGLEVDLHSAVAELAFQDHLGLPVGLQEHLSWSPVQMSK